jgi:hypothetical protein
MDYRGDVTIATGKSRLVREDENDKSDEEGNEDEGSHMTFYKRDEPGRQMQVGHIGCHGCMLVVMVT